MSGASFPASFQNGSAESTVFRAMDRPAKRDYETDEIIVHWDSAKCVHSGNCVRGLASVFNLRQHPWINVDGATADEIAAQVDKCPSGALSYTRKSQG